jgi:hypothetical protein
VKSNSPEVQIIFALRDCFIDRLINAGVAKAGATVFQLNTFEIDLESFRLAQERLLADIAAARLDPEYLDKLIYQPLEASIALAEGDEKAAAEELAQAKRGFEVGVATIVDVNDAQARFSERRGLILRPRIDLLQRQIDVEGQRRRFAAELKDLTERIVLNQGIREVNSFAAPRDCSVELHTYEGAFVEKGDPICTIRFAEAALSTAPAQIKQEPVQQPLPLGTPSSPPSMP